MPQFYFREYHLGDKTSAGALRRQLCLLRMTNSKQWKRSKSYELAWLFFIYCHSSLPIMTLLLDSHICSLRFRSSFQEKNSLRGTDNWPEATFSRRDSLRSDVAKAATLNEDHVIHPHTREEQSFPKSTPKEQKPAASAKTPLRKPQEEDVFRRVHYVNDVMVPDSITGDSMGAWQLSRSMMVHAAAQGDHKWVEQLLKDGSEDIFPDKIGWFPLHYAAKYGHIPVVRLLLEAGRDVNAPAAEHGRTALQAASEGGHEDMVKLLISHGADINAPVTGDYGRTALQAASVCGHEDVVKLLISHGADINAPAAKRNGRTALQAASVCGHEDMVKLLISHGADINAPAAKDGRTALQAASGGGHEDVVKLLISHGADINTPAAEYDGRTALQAASEGGHEDVVKLLISHGADINASAAASNGRTALQAASEGGHEDVIKLLISHGADINAPAAEDDGRTVLQAASGGGHEDMVKLLISYGADINAPAAKYGGTALQAASEGGHEDIVKLLISHGADVSDQEDENEDEFEDN
jgi:ankyrin repeat protein